jgi:hypothetical protein
MDPFRGHPEYWLLLGEGPYGPLAFLAQKYEKEIRQAILKAGKPIERAGEAFGKLSVTLIGEPLQWVGKTLEKWLRRWRPDYRQSKQR